MHVIFVVDRSGSMMGKDEELTQGIRSVVKDNKSAKFSIIQFDQEIEVIARRKGGRSKVVKDYTLQPRGLTAMYDGIGAAFDLIDPSEKTLVVIITDGQENSSQEWSDKQVKKKIKKHQKSGIEFLFLAAGIDAFATRSSLGITAGNSIQINANTRSGFRDASIAMSAITTSYLCDSDAVLSNSITAASASILSDNISYENTQRAERRKGKSYKDHTGG